MIKILCYACNVHLFNTDKIRINFPLAGIMFDQAHRAMVLRPGYLNLDIFCPVCGAFPFYPDSTRTGYKGVGRFVKIAGPDGKPKSISIEDLKAYPSTFLDIDPIGKDAIAEKIELMREVTDKVDEPIKPDAPEFPCLECGSRHRLHKKVCSKYVSIKIPKEVQPADVPEWIVNVVESKVVDPDAPPTADEIAELARDREARSLAEKMANTRKMVDNGR